MYQPRRAGIPATAGSRPTRAVARRAVRPFYLGVADRLGVVFLGLAATATAGAVTLSATASAAPAAAPATMPEAVVRDQNVSRSTAERPQLAVEDAMVAAAAVRQVPAGPGLTPTRTMYAAKKLVVVADPEAGAKRVATVDAAGTLTVTPDTSGKYRLVYYKGEQAWVLNAALANSKPKPKAMAKASASDSGTPGATRKVPGGSVLGLQPEAMVVYRAVMARWDVPSVGGWRAHSRSVHQFGRAIDFMTFSDTEMGYAIAKYVAAHAKEFGVDHIIYRQRIWTPYRPVWRPMEDRGSPTQNHMDHVHVAVKDR